RSFGRRCVDPRDLRGRVGRAGAGRPRTVVSRYRRPLRRGVQSPLAAIRGAADHDARRALRQRRCDRHLSVPAPRAVPRRHVEARGRDPRNRCRSGQHQSKEPRASGLARTRGRDRGDGSCDRGASVTIKLYNTMTRQKEELVTLVPGEIRMYVCGVTVYDRSHIGHARSAIVFDVIQRYLRFKGFRVRFVKNYTDVEDKIIRRANEEGVAATDISERYIAADRADMGALGVRQPDVAPKATEHIPQMIGLIERLVAKDMAYAV